MRLQAAPVADGGLDRQPLLNLAEIDEIREIHRKAEIPEHRLGDPRIAARVLLVAFHHRGGDVEIGRVGEAADHVHRGVGLEPELGTEPRRDVAVMVEIAPLVPDRPEVHVARTVVVPGVAKAHQAGRRAGRPPDRAGRGVFQRRLDGAVQPVIGDQVAVAVLAAFLEPGQRAQQFVVAAPEREAGVVIEPGDLPAHLGRHVGQEILGGGVKVAGEHEILPDHQAQLVAQVIKPVRLIAPAAPDADHVHVRVHRRAQQVAGGFGRDGRPQSIRRNPVRALHEHIAPVDAKGKAGAGGVGVGDQRHRAQANAAADRHSAQSGGEAVQALRPLPRRPPEVRAFQMQHGLGPARRHRRRGTDPGEGELHGLALGPLDMRRDADQHARAGMVLIDDQGRNARPLGLQPDRAVKPERRQRDVPVPAEIALRLAQHVAVRDRAVGGVVGHRIGLRRLPRRAFVHR